jgi:undecaprenyl-diphosphatase
METLQSIDELILLAVNGWRSPWMDEIMWIISGKITWFPLYSGLLITVYLTLKDKKRFLYFILIGGISIGAADAIANFGFKQTIQRPRPSHHVELSEKLHYYVTSKGEEYRGGPYGFVSGHATNSFAIAFFFGLFFWSYKRKRTLYLLLLWAALVAYSRMYLGVHYPSDLLCGGLLGGGIAFAAHRVFQKVTQPESIDV